MRKIDSEDNFADPFMKALASPQFHRTSIKERTAAVIREGETWGFRWETLAVWTRAYCQK
eukprot:14474661-Ditylum_brightwellii.AAC.1